MTRASEKFLAISLALSAWYFIQDEVGYWGTHHRRSCHGSHKGVTIIADIMLVLFYVGEGILYHYYLDENSSAFAVWFTSLVLAGKLVIDGFWLLRPRPEVRKDMWAAAKENRHWIAILLMRIILDIALTQTLYWADDDRNIYDFLVIFGSFETVGLAFLHTSRNYDSREFNKTMPDACGLHVLLAATGLVMWGTGRYAVAHILYDGAW